VELGRVGHYSGRTKDEPPLTLDTQKPVDGGEDGNPAWVSIMYGMINATIVLPVIMSFGTIIYRDQAFAPYMPVLVKLTVISGVVHQLCFSTFSSLPFAVGQVQDAGLIFLSQMASRMVDHCKTRGYDDDTLLATVTVGLSLSTAILGCGLVLMGHLRLAQYVQLLPTR
jgi:SulP family sulfate permease